MILSDIQKSGLLLFGPSISFTVKVLSMQDANVVFVHITADFHVELSTGIGVDQSRTDLISVLIAKDRAAHGSRE